MSFSNYPARTLTLLQGPYTCVSDFQGRLYLSFMVIGCSCCWISWQPFAVIWAGSMQCLFTSISLELVLWKRGYLFYLKSTLVHVDLIICDVANKDVELHLIFYFNICFFELLNKYLNLCRKCQLLFHIIEVLDYSCIHASADYIYSYFCCGLCICWHHSPHRKWLG